MKGAGARAPSSFLASTPTSCKVGSVQTVALTPANRVQPARGLTQHRSPRLRLIQPGAWGRVLRAGVSGHSHHYFSLGRREKKMVHGIQKPTGVKIGTTKQQEKRVFPIIRERSIPRWPSCVSHVTPSKGPCHSFCQRRSPSTWHSVEVPALLVSPGVGGQASGDPGAGGGWSTSFLTWPHKPILDPNTPDPSGPVVLPSELCCPANSS